jgi:nucleoside-triphosphatase
MCNHLFFQGPMRIGKSTCLREIINSSSYNICGFAVQRMMDKNQQAIGYQAAVLLREPVPPVDIEYQPSLPNVFLMNGKKDIGVLEQVITKVEQTAEKNKEIDFIVLDEIGGFELSSKVFMQSLTHILTMGIPCIGILKFRKNLEHLESVMGGQDTYSKEHAQLASCIQQNGRIRTIYENNLGIMKEEVSDFLAENKICRT